MKVEHNGLNRISRSQAEGAMPVEKEQRSDEGARPEGLNRKDEASFSERARLLAKARAELNDLPEARADRVEELRSEVESGVYQVSIEALAGHLLAKLRLDG